MQKIYFTEGCKQYSESNLKQRPKKNFKTMGYIKYHHYQRSRYEILAVICHINESNGYCLNLDSGLHKHQIATYYQAGCID